MQSRRKRKTLILSILVVGLFVIWTRCSDLYADFSIGKAGKHYVCRPAEAFLSADF